MFLGLDIHKRNAQVAVRNEGGNVIEEFRVKNENLDKVAEEYAGGKAVLEATSNYYHIYDVLSEHLDVRVAHPTKITQIGESDKKTDQVDARELSRLLWLDSVPESYVPTDEIRECRVLVRGRVSLVEERTSFVNKVHSLLTDNGITRSVKPLQAQGREYLRELSLPEPWDALLDAYLDVIASLTAQIERLDELIVERAEESEQMRLLKTIPGISHYSAMGIYAEIGDISRFDNAKQVVRYVGLNPVIRESGDSTYEGSISKNGSGTVRWVLVQAVHSAVHTVGDE